MPSGPAWDTFSDTWAATDALGRALPLAAQTGLPRPDRQVGVFYFLWLGAHVQGGPYDVSRILAQDPEAMRKKDSPLWGPLHAPHHWGEPLFGYYLTDDAAVLRKHAQMLADAGVDVVIFDVTNQLTYRPWYTALLRVWTELRQNGNRTPQVAFLCPFWDPGKVVRELWRELYEPKLYRDLWFCWDGKPLILADHDLIFDREDHAEQNQPAELLSGRTLGQTFAVERPLAAVAGRFPTWRQTNSSVTLALFREGPGGAAVAKRRFTRVQDNAWLALPLPAPAPAGRYSLEASEQDGRIGWWSHTEDRFARGEAFADGQPAPGDRTLRLALADETTARIRQFFTFRKPQPDYFQGPTQPDSWSWLEASPQHVFRNSRGEPEQMSVGVAQNAVQGRLGSMSEPGAYGRSHHDGATDARPDAVLHGLNFAEQWARALQAGPQFIFITGWNEWIAGRFDEFNGVRLPVMFVDEFDQEHSRDIEPMNGGHGDSYYYQMAANIRRFKGARPLPPVQSQPIRVDGGFGDWAKVAPEFRDQIGDPVRREHPGYGKAGPYTNHTGRNDLVAAKVSYDRANVYFYVRTREPLTPHTDPNWMLLFLDTDGNATNGWLGYDFVVNRAGVQVRQTTLERHQGPGYRWGAPAQVAYCAAGCELELAVPRAVLGLKRPPATIDFKWADNIQQTGHWSDLTLNGDAAPNDRFNYRARLER